MPLREKHYLRRPDKYFHKIYNAGIADIGVADKTYDDFGTPIGKAEFQSRTKAWYRNLGITAEDVFYARSDNTELQKKIALKGYVEVNTKWQVKITSQNYEVYRVYYNPKDDETELNLVEVSAQ